MSGLFPTVVTVREHARLCGLCGEAFHESSRACPGAVAELWSTEQRNRLVHELHVSAGALRVVTRGVGQKATRGGPGEGDTVYERLDTPDNDPRRQGAFEDLVRERGVITGWSKRSRINMLYRLATLDWDQMPGIPEMVTLTYPAEFPTDGRTVKRHMRMFRQAWQRKWGSAPVGIWKMEFQRRGAPHLHFYVGRPRVPFVAFRRWLSAEWYRIVGSGDLRHLAAGTGVDRQFVCRTKSVRSICWYFMKHNAKASVEHYQNQVPPGFEAPGRFWGVWGLPVVVEGVELTTIDFVAVRRALAALRSSTVKGRAIAHASDVCARCDHADCEAWRLLSRAGHRGAQVRVASGLRGLWTLSVDPVRVARQLAQMLTGAKLSSAERRRRFGEVGQARLSGTHRCCPGACSLGHNCTPSLAGELLQPV